MNLLRHFSRITTPGRKFVPQIDGLRFVAVMAVIAYHIRGKQLLHTGIDPQSPPQDVISAVFQTGRAGVDLFFVISGFVLALPFARHYLQGEKAVRLKAYYLRRVTRLEPPYLIQLVIIFAFTALILRKISSTPFLYQNPHWLAYLFPRTAASAFYVNGLVFRNHPFPNFVLWSLEVEVQFYLVAPFMAKLFAIENTLRRRIVWALLIGISAWLSGRFGATGNYLIGFSLLSALQYFLAGLLLADFYLVERFEEAAQNFFWDIALLACAAATVLLAPFASAWVLFPWLFLGICIAAFRGVIASRILSLRWITAIGGMCYTIYMYHVFMLSAVMRLGSHLQIPSIWAAQIIQFLIAAPLVVILCAPLFIFFERPFMRRDWPAKLRAVIERKSGLLFRNRFRH